MAPSSDPLFEKKNPSPPLPGNSRPKRNRSWLLLAGLLLGFLATVWLLFGDRVIPAQAVKTAAVAAIDAAATESVAGEAPAAADPWEAPVLFQASGWIEPDPYPVRATALTDGVVDEVHVLEGEAVEQGQLLATLIDEDARIALATAEARLAAAETARRIAAARATAAEAALAARRNQVDSAQARLAELQDDADRLRRVGEAAVSAGEIRRAALRVDAQEAVLSVRQAEATEGQAALEAMRAEVDAAGEAAREARSIRDERQLALDRTRIASPIDGIVQRLMAAPGQKKMLRMDNPESATVAILFEPGSLQARIDVPLEQAAALFRGQPVMVRTNFLPDARFRGRVTRIVGEADLQRNTLQAKVELLETDPRLRPEMLCRAEFLSPRGGGGTGPNGGGAAANRLELFIPASAAFDRSGNEASVWTVTPDENRLERREIRLGSSRREGHLQVAEGLRPGEPVVLDPTGDLGEGQRVDPVLP